MIDRQVMLKLLETLERYPQAVAQDVVLVDLNLAATTRTISSVEMVEHITEAESRGWIDKRRGVLVNVTVAITPAGRQARRDLEQGG